MSDGFVAAAAITGERSTRCQMFPPVDAIDGVVHAFRTAGVDRSQAEQYPGCGARPETGTIADLERALKFHVVAALTNIAGAELRQFLGQDRSGAHRRG